MPEVRRTGVFDEWMRSLRDRRAKVKIEVRIDRLAHGNPGNVKPVGEGIGEMRIDHGPGYRIYFVERGSILTILLCGGDKSTQAKDISIAKALAKTI
jgi:putative addiction module killer protein